MLKGAKPAALFLAPEAPYPTIGGGALRSASLLEYLGRRYAVDAVLFKEAGASDPACLLPSGLVDRVLMLELPRHSRRPMARLVRTASRLARGAPPLTDRFSGFGSAVQRFLNDRSYQVALLEHFWCAPYWQQIAPHAKTTVLDLHNVESALMAARAGVRAFPAASVFRRFERSGRQLERQWLPRFNLILTPSAGDANLVRNISPDSRVITYPNAIPTLPLTVVEEEHAIALSGNFEYDPNADAVKYFARYIWPSLRTRWPKLVWRLIGRGPEFVSRYLGGDSRIQPVGPPDDAVRSLAAVQVVVVPVRVGSGTRVKILEAWAAGRAVVSTSLGAEGLPAKDQENILIADSPTEFAASVTALLQSAELRGRLGRAGRLRYEADFTWEAAWAALAAEGI